MNLVFGFLAYTILVILWGAWVRFSGSGDGCGENWPLCHDQFIPTTDSVPTWIEFSHRFTSGLFGIIVFAIFVWVWVVRRDRQDLKWISVFLLIFTISEALIGARLVLKGLVGENDSVSRAFTMSLHFLNSMILVGSVTLFWWAIHRGPLQWRVLNRRRTLSALAVVILFFLVGSTGAIASLAGTLFPSESLVAGILADFSRESHFLVRLRIWHPLSSTLVASCFVALLYFWSQEQDHLKKPGKQAISFIFVAVPFGFATLFLLSPLWMKLTHLLFAYCLWILILRFLALALFEEKTHA